MRRLALLIFCLLYAMPAAAQPWQDEDLGDHIREGAANRQFIWLLGGSEKLVRFDRATGARQIVAQDVLDMMIEERRIWILAKGADNHSLLLRDLTNVGEQPKQIDVVGKPIGLFRTDDRFGVLTTTAVVSETEQGWLSQSLPATLAEGGLVTAVDNGDVFYGLNRGEWGGGLRRLHGIWRDISIVANSSDELCEGDLNPACRPIVGLFSDTSDTACVIVASGLAHLGLRHGAVFRVCGSAITPVFSAPLQTGSRPFGIDGQTWPFYSLTKVSAGWIAISDDRYFRSTRGDVREHELPRFRDWSGLRISAAQEDVIFVMSACCWGLASNPTLFSTLAVPIVED